MDKQGERKIALTEKVITWNIQDLPDDLKDLLIEGMVGRLQFREHFRLVLGAADRGDPMKVWAFFDKQGYLPVRTEGKASDIHHISKVCLNGASNAGNHIVEIRPAADSSIEILWASIMNGDVVNRTLSIILAAAGGAYNVNILAQASTAAGEHVAYPNVLSSVKSISKPSLTLTDNFELLLLSTDINVGQDTFFYVVYKQYGAAPTIVYTEPAGAVWGDIPP